MTVDSGCVMTRSKPQVVIIFLSAGKHITHCQWARGFVTTPCGG